VLGIHIRAAGWRVNRERPLDRWQQRAKQLRAARKSGGPLEKFPASVLPPYAASLAWALMMVLVYYLVAAWLDRRGIYLKL